jgi:hypothetical protein
MQRRFHPSFLVARIPIYVPLPRILKKQAAASNLGDKDFGNWLLNLEIRSWELPINLEVE